MKINWREKGIPEPTSWLNVIETKDGVYTPIFSGGQIAVSTTEHPAPPPNDYNFIPGVTILELARMREEEDEEYW